MKPRSESSNGPGRSAEFKGVVKKMTGKLTSNPELEREGDTEMMGDEGRTEKARRGQTNPDPHRRG